MENQITVHKNDKITFIELNGLEISFRNSLKYNGVGSILYNRDISKSEIKRLGNSKLIEVTFSSFSENSTLLEFKPSTSFFSFDKLQDILSEFLIYKSNNR
ncbi:MAG: hypothetical protein PHG06_21875 [Parabacteroides sp.]|nr:hypothetical protein [Parabacteroides sp.]